MGYAMEKGEVMVIDILGYAVLAAVVLVIAYWSFYFLVKIFKGRQ